MASKNGAARRNNAVGRWLIVIVTAISVGMFWVLLPAVEAAPLA